MSVTQLRPFLIGLFILFFASWLGLIAFPWVQVGHLGPLTTEDTITPWDVSGEAHAGERVYAANGCVYCHTQQVRDVTAGSDSIRGWAKAGKDADDKVVPDRRTYPRDYIWQGRVFLGNNRQGADLSNVGARFSDAKSLYLYLYNPYLKNPGSSMPAYRFLFAQHKIGSQPATDAVALTGELAPPPGYEIVPTSEGRALVAYLLSLNKNYLLPEDQAKGPAQPPPAE